MVGAYGGGQCEVQLAAGRWLAGGLVLLREGSECDLGDGAQESDASISLLSGTA